MNIGINLVCIGFVILYIVFQLVPLLYFLSIFFDKEVRKEMTFNHWLLAPLIALLLLTPAIGTIIGLPFQNDDNKWLQRFAFVAVYLIIIGIIIFIVTK